MHVKRHLSRLFGSLRRKDNKNLSEKVLQQLQSRDKQTSSRWELLDHDKDEEVNTQEVPAISDPKHGKTFKTSDKTESLSLNYHEVQVELNLHKNSKRCKNKDFQELPSTPKTNTDIAKLNQDEQPHPINKRNVNSFGNRDKAINVTSVVQEINETITLINEFDPEPVAIQSKVDPIRLEEKADAKSPKPNIVPTTTTFWADMVHCNNEDTQKRNNLDTISKVEEGTRLTRGFCSQSLERDVINLGLKTEMGATVSVLEDEDRDCDDYPNWVKSAPSCFEGRSSISGGGYGEHRSGSEISGTLARESYKSPSRPGAGRPRSLRNSGKRLYNKIHKRFNKKSDETENVGYDEDDYNSISGNSESCMAIATTTDMSPSAIPANSSYTIKDACCKGDEIKSIDARTKDAAALGGGGSYVSSSPGPEPDDTRRKSSRGGKLSRSFRKVISFPRSSFKPLDNNKMEQEVGDEIDGIQEVRNVEASGSVNIQRKLSLRALRKPGKGMKKILMKGVTAFGKSMIHASAVMPTQYECPTPSRNYEDPYWGDEDYYHDYRRRYCQSADGVVDFQNGASRSSRMNGFYQHGYCYNG